MAISRLDQNTYLYLSFMCDGKSLLLYCIDIALRSFLSRPCLPVPCRAGSKFDLIAVVMFLYKNQQRTNNKIIGSDWQWQICTDPKRSQDRTRLRNYLWLTNALDHRIYIMRSASSVSNEGSKSDRRALSG